MWLQTRVDDRREGTVRASGGTVRGGSLQGMMPEDHLAQHDAPRIDVRARGDRPTEQLLGGHVRGRTEQEAGTREARNIGALDLSDSEIEDLDASVRLDQ